MPLPTVDEISVPDVLFYPFLFLDPRRPTGSKAMADAQGARQRIANLYGPGAASLISPIHRVAIGQMAQ